MLAATAVCAIVQSLSPAPALGTETAHIPLLQIPCYSHRRLLLLTQRPALLIIHSLHRCTKRKALTQDEKAGRHLVER